MKDKNDKNLKELIFFKVNKYSVISMLAAIAINLAGHYGMGYVSLPFWLDTIGTMFAAIQFGPLAGVIVGAISQLIFGLTDGTSMFYLVVSVTTGLIVGFLFPRKHREDTLVIVTVGILAALASTLLCTQMNIFFYNGYTGNKWGDALFKMLSRTVNSVEINAFLAEGFVDLPDRVLSIFAALFLVDIEETRIFKKKNRSITRSVAGILVLIMAGGFLLQVLDQPVKVFADQAGAETGSYDFTSDFETVMYGSDEGILTSQVNAVIQTQDGYMWVGTYSGLYKYNGIRFEQADIDDRIRNVMALFVDSSGRLWIGTNDSGAFCYNPYDSSVQAFSEDEGLDANSIRTINEDTAGNVYLGTVRSITKISPDGRIKTFNEWQDIYYSVSFTSLEDGSMLGVTNGGVLFLIKNDLLIATDTYGSSENVYYRIVANEYDSILVGTTSNEIIKYKIVDNEFVRNGRITVPGNSYFNVIRYSPQYDGFFYCAENGFGFIDEVTFEVTDMTEADFSSSASDVCVDYQGNVWFASNKQGLLKCSSTPFRNVFKKAGLESSVVNAVLEDNGVLYVGMDNGLKMIDLSTNRVVYRRWISTLDGVRVRHIMKDSRGNLWISTYGQDGLLKVDTKGNVRSFNEQNGGMLGGRMRTAIELSDGRILVASNMGLSFIENDVVVATIGEDNGLNNQYILSMCERDDGTILAASDGDGIYIISNDRVAGHIGAPEGLETDVVLRIVKGHSGYFYVTSNALYFDDGNGVRRLENFPYTNNYDVIISGDKCWIPSSAGLFLVSEETLVGDGEYSCTLLNKNWGLNTSFTAVSWNGLSDGKMYLCCTDGVRCLPVDGYMTTGTDYQIHLESVETGDKVVNMTDGRFIIPPSSGRISFNIAVNNYTLTNPLLHYYLEGTGDSGIMCYQNEIVPLEYTNLGYGEYKLHIQVRDETTGGIVREEVFLVEKQAMMYEKLYFRAYLIFVGSMIAFYVVWLFLSINKRASKIRGLQKEISTDPMTGLYNKAASERILTKTCSESQGILMMIDLDSFKLVNDIYGHDMGDRILIRFAELITEAVGEGNIGGRLGGDEFIGFIKNTMDEEDVDVFTKFLNKEIVKSAKEFMGDDMNIPLGASVGAVRVPVEGKDFSDLFRYADKALYIVKQNGKHGYAFYQKGSDNKDAEGEGADKNNLAQIKKIIGERNEGKGAFLVNFEKLQVIYKFLNRSNKVTSGQSGFVRIVITSDDGSKVPDDAKDSFEEILITDLKKNDVVARYAGHFYVIFNGNDPASFDGIVTRITEKWKTTGNYEKYSVRTEIERVGE
ncbi:MAG: diguanylate cyclase [Clostridiales bacterium]|nr:diguanylate cyclase [Clostridiales bacterium]